MYEHGLPAHIAPLSPVRRIDALEQVVRSMRVFARPPLYVSYTPDGTYLQALISGSAPTTAPAAAHPAPWDMTIRQDPAGCKFSRTFANMGGVFRPIILSFEDGATGEYTPFPDASEAGEWIIAVKISVTVDGHGTRTSTGSILFYPDTNAGTEQLQTAGETQLDAYILPLYVVTFTPASRPAQAGTWSISADLRTTPAVIIYA